MNQRTELLTEEFKPELSIIVYKSTQTTGLMNEHSFYLESHQINEQGQVLEGKPLEQQTIEEMVGSFYSDQRDRSQLSGLVPDNLLFYKPRPGGKYMIIWYRPAEIRFYHFAKQLKIESGKMWTPAMIYVVDGKELDVFSVKKDGRPDDKMKLYRAPFHNVADDGRVCLGNAYIKKPSDKSFASTIKYWEDLFWLSEFSHLNGASNPTKSELKDVYNRLLKSKCKKKWSDLDELKPISKQIKSILS